MGESKRSQEYKKAVHVQRNAEFLMATLSAIQTAAMNDPPMNDGELLNVFKALDPEGKGSIPAAEFLKSLTIFGGDQAFTDEEIKILKAEMNMDESKVFNYIEFMELRQVLLKRKI